MRFIARDRLALLLRRHSLSRSGVYEFNRESRMTQLGHGFGSVWALLAVVLLMLTQ
jgi:hypothetical protein